MQGIKNKLLNEHVLMYMLCLAVILGPAISVLFQYDLSHFPDSKTYLGLAGFDFDQSPVRRYRVLVPFAAALLSKLFGGAFVKLAPAYFTGDFALAFAFFIINTTLMAYFGLLIYRYCKSFEVTRMAALIGTLAMLTCRYTGYNAALPIIDSLFCVVVAMTLTGLREKNTSLLIWAIFLGPWAKESFIFIAPLIFFYSHIGKKKQLLCFLLSGALIFTYRALYDYYAPKPAVNGMTANFNHIPGIIKNIPMLLSFSGFYKILMNTGIWIAAPLLLLWAKPASVKTAYRQMDRYLLVFMLLIIVQMLLSGSFERMFYLAMPVICAIVALSVDELRKCYQPRKINVIE